jgi:hypothetical protein
MSKKITAFLSIATVLTLAALVVFIIGNLTQGYIMKNASWIIAAGIASFALISFAAYTYSKFSDKVWLTGILFISLILVCVSFGFTLIHRIDLAASLLTFDHSNTLAWRAFNTGMVNVGLNLIAAIILTICSFSQSGNKNLI